MVGHFSTESAQLKQNEYNTKYIGIEIFVYPLVSSLH